MRRSYVNICEQLKIYIIAKHDAFIFSPLAVKQINPHLINCNSPLKDPFCKDGVSPRFCNEKEFGVYAHPTFCNKIIFCGPGRQDVETCPIGTGFNPFFRNCDWPGFLRCVDIRIGMHFLKNNQI